MPRQKPAVEPKETPAPRSGSRGPKPDEAKRKVAFLEAFRNAGTVRKACERTNTPRLVVHGWLDTDPQFVAEYDLAWEDFVDSILDTMVALGRGTTQGKRKPNFTALVALLNAFHCEFNRMGADFLERRLFRVMDRVANVAAKFLSAEDLEKFRQELDAEAAAEVLGGAPRKKSRE